MTGWQAVTVLLACVLAGGCVSVKLGNGKGNPASYQLTDARFPVNASEARLPLTVLVQSFAGDPVAGSLSMAFTNGSGQRRVYQLSNWTQRPANALPRLLLHRLEARASFTSVAGLGEGVDGDLLLGVSVETILHDAAILPGAALLVVRADLIDRRSRRLLARRTFDASVKLPQVGPSALVNAMGLAVSDLFDQLVPWLETSASEFLSEASQGTPDFRTSGEPAPAASR